MPALSPTQAIVLMKASDRSDGNVLPLPGSLRGGAASKVVQALLSRGLIREGIIESHAKPDAALNTVWRNEPDGRAVLLFVTDAGLEAIGVKPAVAASSAEPVEASPKTQARPRAPREGTKHARVIAMLQSTHGASIDEIASATAWQSHTVRGFISGALKKKRGLVVTSDRIEERGRVYRIG
jgi:hypothetical protein